MAVFPVLSESDGEFDDGNADGQLLAEWEVLENEPIVNETYQVLWHSLTPPELMNIGRLFYPNTDVCPLSAKDR
ncbi:MAG: hypothetical protein WCN98_07450 [Verrucomicrobiaceae bacterium]